MADSWLGLFERTSAILDEAQVLINERNKAARAGAAGARGQGDAIQRSINQASANIENLGSDLRRLQGNRSLGAGEIHRREDQLQRLTTRRNELDHLSKFSPQTGPEAERAQLLSGGHAGGFAGLNLFGASETDNTRNVGTGELVGSQRTRMDSELTGRLDVLGQSISRSGEAARQIGDELDLQIDLIDDLHHGVTRATIAVSQTTGKVMSFSEKATAGGLMISVVVFLVIDILAFILLMILN